jgi:DNA-binding transcriptional MerR regulator
MNDTWLGPRAVAAATGVSTDTLRHYERLKLLPSVTRTRAGYRRYPPTSIERVKLIQRALIVGFSLKELATALGQRETGTPPCRRVRNLMSDRLNGLDARLAELTAIRDEMRVVLRDWDQRLAETPTEGRARLLDMLTGRPALERRR